MVQFVSDLAALGAFGTAAYKIALGWYRFRASRNKRVVQTGPFEAVGQVRAAPRMLIGAPFRPGGLGQQQKLHYVPCHGMHSTVPPYGCMDRALMAHPPMKQVHGSSITHVHEGPPGALEFSHELCQSAAWWAVGRLHGLNDHGNEAGMVQSHVI